MRIQGVRFGPDSSVRVRQGNTVLEAVVTAAGADRIEAIMPPTAPTGEVWLTVARGGQISSPFAVKVVESSFGIFTEGGLGFGPATNVTAARGETVTIHGTGLGSIRRPEVLAGGSPGVVRYAGPWRGHAGADEIQFSVPKDAPEGCFVPVEVRSGGVTSSIVTIPIAHKGQPCPQTAPWLDGEGLVVLARARTQLGLSKVITDAGLAHFGAGLANALMLPPAGVCTAYQRTLTQEEIKELWRGGARRTDATDAGTIAISGAKGSQTMAVHPRGPFSYWNVIGGADMTSRNVRLPLLLDPGQYSISGTGSKAVAGFRTEAQMPPPIQWTGRAPQAIAWKGARSEDVILLAATNTDQTTGAFGLVVCATPAASGSFRIPPRLLAKLPAGGDGPMPLKWLVLAHLPKPQKLTGRVAGAAALLEFQKLELR
jgi:hypothetical protein